MASQSTISSTQTPIANWSVDDVSAWLLSQNLDFAAPIFKENGVDGNLLIQMNSEILNKRLNIKVWAKRKRVMDAIDAIVPKKPKAQPKDEPRKGEEEPSADAEMSEQRNVQRGEIEKQNLVHENYKSSSPRSSQYKIPFLTEQAKNTMGDVNPTQADKLVKDIKSCVPGERDIWLKGTVLGTPKQDTFKYKFGVNVGEEVTRVTFKYRDAPGSLTLITIAGPPADEILQLYAANQRELYLGGLTAKAADVKYVPAGIQFNKYEGALCLNKQCLTHKKKCLFVHDKMHSKFISFTIC